MNRLSPAVDSKICLRGEIVQEFVFLYQRPSNDVQQLQLYIISFVMFEAEIQHLEPHNLGRDIVGN